MNKSEIYKRLTEAVQMGISKALDGDEMFDRDDSDELSMDMGDIEDTSVYINCSKQCGELKSFLQRFSFSYRFSVQITRKDIEMLTPFFNDRERVSADALELFDTEISNRHKDMLRWYMTLEDFIEWIMVGKHNVIAGKNGIKGCNHLTEDMERFRDTMLMKIRSKTHPFYGCYSFADSGDLFQFMQVVLLGDGNVFGNDANFNWIDVSLMEDMSSVFSDTDFNGDVSLWQLDNAKTLEFMFAHNKKFNGDISKWKFPKVRCMANMFYYSGFTGTEHGIGNWTFPEVTDMWNMFAYSKFNGNISKWKFPKVRCMNNMFFGARKFRQNISDWKIHMLCKVDNMFDKCGLRKSWQPKSVSVRKNWI